VEVFNNFIQIINTTNIELTWIFFLITCFAFIFFFLKFFGFIGLYIYSAIAIICANIQVLKTVDFLFFPEPVALGTILFATTFLCTDILAEHYGKEKAKLNVLIGFFSFLTMTIIMIFTIGFKHSDEVFNNEVQKSLSILFTPMPIFFVASMIAYLISQYFDIWFFLFIKKLTKNKYLWFRNNISTLTSSLIDNTIFSLLAWIILNPNPLELYVVLTTYILGTYILRIFLALVDTPIVYLAKYFISSK